MADVLCFGNLQLDILCRSLTDLPPPGELRMLDAVDFALSGNGGNVAAALARLGVSVELAGYSGADVVGEQFRANLEAEGVGLGKLLRHPSAATGASVVAIAPGGDRSIVFVNGANDAFDLDTVPDEWLRGPAIVAVTAVFVLPQFTGDAVGRLFRRAHAAGARTLLNICWDAEGRGLPFLAPALAEADYFVLNHDEGRLLTGHVEPERILDVLMEHTSGAVILTLGPGGCCVRTEQGVVKMPALPVEAIDCTGAGDAFVAGFTAGLVDGRSLVECARLACAVAAYAVTGPGAFTRVPRLADIDRNVAGEGDPVRRDSPSGTEKLPWSRSSAPFNI